MEYNYKKIRIGPLNTSNIEITDLLKAWIAVSIAFGIVFGKNQFGSYLNSFILAAVVVGSGFLLHELGHKIIAQRYHYFAEFRAFNEMLFLAIIMSFFGFVFAAPGAVMIQTDQVNRKRNGKISAAGPLVNIFLAGAFIIVLLLSSGFLNTLAQYGIRINGWLALFNLIPVWNFDGAKVWRWNKLIWVSMVIVAAVIVFIL
ncbi:hypothetical protein HZB00_01665 [Candidatus Woesearchaeota archaeon]|nr:hypothetical protein [Candidatus Woesearchaeota archaeon]